MSWYRTGRVVVTNGSKTVTGVGTLFTTAVNVGDAFALVDANLNPTGAWYEVEAVVSNTEITLKQSYAGTTEGNNQYCVFNMVGNMTTPSFAQRLATFFASFQSLIDKPTATPTASSIPIADTSGKIAAGWLPDASAAAKGAVELASDAEVLAGTDKTRAITPAGAKSVYAPLISPALTGTPTVPTATEGTSTTQIANTIFVNTAILNKIAVANAMTFKGTLGTGGTVTALPTSGYEQGWLYKVITAGTYAGVACEIGDLIVALADFDTTFKNSDWVRVPIADEMNLKADVTYAEYLSMEGDPA